MIPEGHYFLLGDNWNESLDSRIWGVLERGRIRGRVGTIYFPLQPRLLPVVPFHLVRDRPVRAITSGNRRIRVGALIL